MQVDIDVTCMYTNFGGRVLFGFGDIATIKNSQISLSDLSKSLINWNRLKKFMQVDIDVTCMYINFGGHVLFDFGDIATIKNSQISLSDLSKNLIDRNQLKKFMQVDIDVTCLYTDFGGRVIFGFGDTTTLKNDQISLSDHPWSSKNLINRNWPKKFMQVGIDVKFMHTKFGGCDLSSFGDIATFQKRPNFPFDPWTIVHGHQKI